MPSKPHISTTTFIARLLLLLCASLLVAGTSFGQSSPEIDDVVVGIDATAKLGKWVPVTIHTVGTFENAPVSCSVTALDSTATKVSYRGTLIPMGEGTYQAWAKIGRQHGKVDVRLFDPNGNEVSHQSVLVSKASDLRPSTENHLFVIGGSDELVSNLRVSMKALFKKDAFQVIDVDEPKQLPSQWIGFDGVDTVLLSTHNMPLLEQISERQWLALLEWVQRGGRLIVSANGKHDELRAGGLLSRFVDGKFNDTVELESVVKLDSFVKNRLNVDSLEVASLTIDEGEIALADGDLPLVFRQLRGFGQIVIVTFDISAPVFDDWKGTDAMLLRLLKAGELDELVKSKDQSTLPTSAYGYRDITGQLKVPLEQFSQVQMINFTVVAVLIGLYILCIGPGDFFFLKRFARKMELTWVTFTVVTLGFCGLAVWLSTWSRPQQFQFNQLEIIDIDATSNSIRANAWSNIYSPRTGKHEISFNSDNSYGLQEDAHLTSWHGTPGDGVGGMQAKAGLTSQNTTYEIKIVDEQDGVSTRLEQVPLQVSATRMLHTEWSGRVTKKIESNLRIRNSRLTGQISNPFPFEIKNIRVIYGNYVYIMSNTLAAESTMDISGETVERTRKSYMNRQTRVVDPEKKDRAQNVPWDPSSSRMDRIAEMMMFHEIAGGQDYTSLTHDFQNRIDMSEHLDYGHAIFVGEVDSKVCQVTVDGENSTEHYDKELTVVRILLPVE